MTPRIFVSYGHNDYDSLVLKMVNDLRDAGFAVFLDKDYLNVGDWEVQIDNHIIESKYFLFMVSARSVSKDGYCLNELCRALENRLTIIPVILDESPLPLSIVRLERIYINDYNKALDKIVSIVSGTAEMGFADMDLMIKRCLKPISSDSEISRHSIFMGREEVFKEFEDFMASSNNIWWIPASPGTGKTAFSAKLCVTYPDLIVGSHFCKFNILDKKDPKLIFTTLAYGLAQAYPEYETRLLNLNDLDKLFEKTAESIFDYIFSDVIYDLKPNRNYVMLIDALDEASFGGNNEVCAILQRACSRGRIPSWLKFVLTSRNESEITTNLSSVALISKQFDCTTEESIEQFYRSAFPGVDDDKIEILLNKSEGSFLYAVEIVKKIKANVLTLSNINLLPPGIYGFYNDCMNRIFSKSAGRNLTFEDARHLLEFLCIYTDNVNEVFLVKVLRKDEYYVREVLSAIQGLFNITEENIEPIHKSLIDWFTDSANRTYYVSRKNGFKILYEYLKPFYDRKIYSNSCLLKYYGKTLVEQELDQELFDMLDNYKFVSTRIRKLHFDAGLREYLNEISACEFREDIFGTETFRHIFEEYRRLLYNSGMFFILRDLGFTSFLAENGSDEFDLEGQIGIAFYYYIVEDFNKAIKQCKSLLATSEIKEFAVYEAEIYNIKGLSERKIVEFDNAVTSFKSAIESAQRGIDQEQNAHGDSRYELSMAYLLLGKIYTNMLDFEAADKSLDMSVDILQERISMLPDGDTKTANILFLAEEYRVYAYTCIWEGNYEKAKELLVKCEEIYKENRTSTDRYFLRYQYTSCFLNIMTSHYEGVSERLNLLLSNAKGEYDKGTINAYLGLLAAVHQSDQAYTYLDKAKSIFNTIGAYLEYFEAGLIEDIYKSQETSDSCDARDYNDEYIKTWMGYARNHLSALISK